MRKHHKTIVISDVHLGSRHARVDELTSFLKANTCEVLILNGDIIDGWQFKKGRKWKKKYTRLFRIVLRMIEKHSTEVVYIRGNHDDFLDNIIPFIHDDIWIVKNHIHYSKGKKYLVLHGDIFDPIANNFRWLLRLGFANYGFALWVNRVFNYMHEFNGLPRFSLSRVIKQKAYKKYQYISDYEKELVKQAREKGCHGVICGHIHEPSIVQHEDVVYMNSGDWVDSMSALVEDYKGNWNIVRYAETNSKT